jgi:hypothetical protein
VKDFRPLDRPLRPQFPTFVCSSIERGCGHVCGIEAKWQAPWSPDGSIVRVYCDDHKPEGATEIPLGARFMLSRVELRVVIPAPLSDPFDAANQAVRKVTDALEAAGGLVVGVRVVGQKADEGEPEAPPLRLQLAGRPEPAVRGDRPFWGPLWPRVGRPAWRRRKTG